MSERGMGRPRVGQVVVCGCRRDGHTCDVVGVLVATWCEAEPMGDVQCDPERPWGTVCRMSVLRLAPWGVAAKIRRRG